MGEDSRDDQIIGVQQLYCSPEEPEIDIVAVHGINGHAIKTWTTVPQTGSDKGVCWLNHPEFLPAFVGRVRVLSWGYNANVTSLQGPTSSSRVLQHAQTLVQELQGYRNLKGGKERPIIFICHSLGGIVVKRALAYSEGKTTQKVAHLRLIFTCTYGIVFFGTPHHGSSAANLAGILENVVRMTVPRRLLRTESNLLRALEEESETLQNITDQFVAMMFNFQLMFLWEEQPTAVRSMGKMYIVKETSAAPALPDVERCGIAADHRNMCRFARSSDAGFLAVADALRRFSQDATSNIQRRCMEDSWTQQLRNQRQYSQLLNVSNSLVTTWSPPRQLFEMEQTPPGWHSIARH